MTDKNLANWISSVCRDVGKNKGIEFHPPAPRGAQVPKRWEVSCRLKRHSWATVNLSYWFSADSLVSEEVNLLWAFPPTLKQSEKFKSDISAKIDQMLRWIKRMNDSESQMNREIKHGCDGSDGSNQIDPSRSDG
jgi:hypothetical protein